MIALKKINDFVINPPPQFGSGTFAGADILPSKYANVALIAATNSGKTNVIYNMLQRLLADKKERRNTVVMAVSSTIQFDKMWGLIRAWLEKRKVPFVEEIDIKNTENGQNFITNMLSYLNHAAAGDEGYSVDPGQKYILILDDQGAELRSKEVSNLLKKSRHFRIKVIVSSQWVNDISREGRRQIKVWILFRGHSREKLGEIYEAADMPIEFDDFIRLYNDATSEPYNFLYVDTKNKSFRRNFDREYKLEA